jgi:hypothetical protein
MILHGCERENIVVRCRGARMRHGKRVKREREREEVKPRHSRNMKKNAYEDHVVIVLKKRTATSIFLIEFADYAQNICFNSTQLHLPIAKLFEWLVVLMISVCKVDRQGGAPPNFRKVGRSLLCYMGSSSLMPHQVAPSNLQTLSSSILSRAGPLASPLVLQRRC